MTKAKSDGAPAIPAPSVAEMAVRAFRWVHEGEELTHMADSAPLTSAGLDETALVQRLVGSAPSSVKTMKQVRALVAKMVVADGQLERFNPEVSPYTATREDGTDVYRPHEAALLDGLLCRAILLHGAGAVYAAVDALLHELYLPR